MQDLRDILPPMDVPFWTPANTALAVCTSILVIAVIAFAAWRWHKRVRHSRHRQIHDGLHWKRCNVFPEQKARR